MEEQDRATVLLPAFCMGRVTCCWRIGYQRVEETADFPDGTADICSFVPGFVNAELFGFGYPSIEVLNVNQRISPLKTSNGSS